MIAAENFRTLKEKTEKSREAQSEEAIRLAEELGVYGFRGRVIITTKVELDPTGPSGDPDSGAAFEDTVTVRFNRN